MAKQADMRIAVSVAVFAACATGMYMHSTGLDMFQITDGRHINATTAGLASSNLWARNASSCQRLWGALPHFLQSWLRNYLLGTAEYLALGFIWSYYVYYCFGTDLYPAGNVPRWSDMFEQIRVASKSMPLFSLLPTVIEALCERGYTMTYGHISEMGFPKYLAYLFVYMFFVEFGIYWMHRLLHDVPAGYKYLHKDHHKYNKDHTMSPFAGLAFHPVDGILQAIPHLFAIMIIPTHFLTHEILLFTEAIWTANIHDNIHLNLLPFMGAGWHTIHHTTYKHNYGHYFVFMDWFYGTLISPEEHAAQQRSKAFEQKSF